jgi:uncharacterized membrane protein
MDENKFLNELEKELKDISYSEKEDILDDYKEHFKEAKSRGESEDKIIEKLGDPRSIAKDIKAYSVVEKAENNLSAPNVFKVILTFLSLGMFNLILVFPYLGVVSILFGLGIGAIALIFAGGLGIVASFVDFLLEMISLGTDPWRSLLYSFLAVIAGFIIGALDFFMIKYLYKFTIKYIKMNLNIIKEEK